MVKRKKSLLTRGGPELVITKCILILIKLKAKLNKVYPSKCKFKRSSRFNRFELGNLNNIKNTKTPQKHELKIIREDIDPHGYVGNN